MNVIKKSGKIEPFAADKLYHSIAAASDDAKTPMNQSDLKIFVSEFLEVVKEKDTITSQQIDVIICGLLYLKGHFKVLEQYLSYKKHI